MSPMQSAASTRSLAYAWALLACGVTALAATPLLEVVDPANIIVLFLLTVALVARFWGSGPALAAALASVALFDFFFVPPRFTFAVADAQYLLSFAVMLVVALIIGQLMARLREEAESAARREAQTRALYEMARELSAALTASQVAEIVSRFLAGYLRVAASLYLPDQNDHLTRVAPESGVGHDHGPAAIPHVTAVFESGAAMSLAAEESGYAPALALPLVSPVRCRGVLLAAAPSAEAVFAEEQRPLLEAVASLVAIAVERLHYVDVAQQATLNMESERLRSALLSAVSHDLRTPLTVLVGLADSLALARPPLPVALSETATALRDQALRLSGLVHNLLDMARFQVGKARLKKEWQPLEEVVGAALKDLGARLESCPIRIDLAADLPPLEFDAVLMERVLCNLLENAVKYAPQGPIAIEARQAGEWVAVSVLDEGPGLPQGVEESLFELFERGRHEGTATGVGLGLAICRAIVEAHGGTIRGENRPEGGARFTFTLPVGEPPAMEMEEEKAQGDD